MMCPNCKTGLRLSGDREIPVGARIRCPKCSTVFTRLAPVSKQRPSGDMVLKLDGSGAVLELRGGFHRDLFVRSDKILGRRIFDVMVPDIIRPVKTSIETALQTGELQSFEFELPSDHSRYGLKFIGTGGDSVLVIISDVTLPGRSRQSVNYLAYYDALTRLPNRYLFNDRLSQAISYAERADRSIAVLFLDLDNFKIINDSLGHRAGDELLKTFATRLMKGLRSADTVSHFSVGEPMTARLGGDEFVLLLRNMETVHDPAVVAERIQKMLSEPFMIGSHELFVTASIGIAVYPLDGKDMDTLLINADVAMYEAKKYGKNNYRYYSESMNKCAFERFVIENKLRKALAHNEFMLFYQPQIKIHTGKLIGVEALVRWLQPDLVLMRPGEFIPLAEKNGMIVQIGEWILRAACEQSRAWQKAGLSPMLMTVNVSGVQFGQDNFVETVSGVLNDTGMDPNLLQIELTESTIMQDYESTIQKLRALQAMGVKASIDDFGTGYSSLKYLKHFPLDTLKIDGSFVRGLITSAVDQSIVHAIIALARNFNLKVIAEGVETREQLTYLRESGCEAMQGYLVCPPVNSSILAEFAKKGRYL